jgi:uncharacterized protein (TIGR02246 family)
MKTNYLAFSLLAIGMAALVGCGQQPQSQPQSESRTMTMEMPDPIKEEAAIRSTDAQWLAAAKARDAAKVAGFWSADATLLFPNQAPVTGKDAILEYVTNAFKDPDFSVTWTTDKIVISHAGDMAYETGTDTVTFRQGKKVVTAKNNGAVIWKKQPDGQWKAVIDIGTPAPPEAAPKKK